MTLPAIGFLGLLTAYVIHVAFVGRRQDRKDPLATMSTLVTSVAPFVVICCYGIARLHRKGILGAYLQLIVFALGCFLAAQQGEFSRRLISPVHIGLGLAAGHLIFGVSLLVTQRSARAAAEHFVDFGALWNFAIDSPMVLLQYVSVGIAEEIIYRAGAQPLLIQWTGSAAAGIVIVALVFSIVHEHFFRNAVLQSAEFLGFALLLGVLYYWTGSLILVIVVHAVRNIEIAFLEHLLRIEEYGSEDLAVRESEFLCGERLLVLLVLPAHSFEVTQFEYAIGAGQAGRLMPVAPGSGPACLCGSTESS